MNRKIRTTLYLLTVLLVLSLLHPLTIFAQESPVQMYWLAHFAGAVQRANLDGSNVQNLVTGLVFPQQIALDMTAGKMYWTDGGTSKVQRANLDGSNVETLATELINPGGIALDVAGGKMYWTVYRLGEIQRANLDGSNVETLIPTDLMGPLSIALDIAGGKMYWTEVASAKIQQANLDGSDIQTIIDTGATGVGRPHSIALDVAGGKLYWTDWTTRKIRRANLDGSGVEELLSGLRNPLGIALSLPQTTEQATAPEELIADINGDGVINIQDLVIVATSFGATGENAADVNGDGVVNIIDLTLVAGALGEAAAAPSAHAEVLTHLTANEVKQWLRAAQQANLTDPAFQRGLEVLKHLLTVLIPKETVLLANYPNPFNPETWIPYQLATPADVALHIHAVDGSLVRTLSLGHQAVGIYQNRSRAAYWDGRNEIGEPVASGVYFYTLTAGDFNATRKMLIRK